MLTIRRSAVVVAALAALGLGGAALAGAADNGSSTSTSTSTDSRPAGTPQAALSADVAAKVKAAALAKVPGATVPRTEAGGPYNSAYHAHIRTSAGALRSSSSTASSRRRPSSRTTVAVAAREAGADAAARARPR